MKQFRIARGVFAVAPGLLTWGLEVSRWLVSSLFDCKPALRPDRGDPVMARAEQVKVGPQGRREAAWP